MGENIMEWNDEYKQRYYGEIQGKLPSSFAMMYEKNNWLHDWYLKNFYMANTGSAIQVYSIKGSATFQIELCNGGPDKNILLIYKNVMRLTLDFTQSLPAGGCHPTGFGLCITNVFDIDNDSNVSHDFLFENDDRIFIKCQSVSYRRIADDYWR